MKRAFTILAAVLLTATLWAQNPPQKMSYQAIIRDSDNKLVVTHDIGIRVSILQGSSEGTEVFKEIYNPNPQTNVNGLVLLEIGGGIPITGTFSNIDWGNGPYFIKTETDPTGGTNYSITGTSQLLTVPYSMFAKTAGSLYGHYVGELYGGGVVFWVDQTGNHGLICSMIDVGTSTWSNITSTLIGATASSDWDGLNNSNAIIGQSGHTSSAAKLCLDYTNTDYGSGIYSDWYLPSLGELNDLWNNFKTVQKVLDSDGNSATTALFRTAYWTSSEQGSSNAFSYFFYFGNTQMDVKTSNRWVRAIRAF